MCLLHRIFSGFGFHSCVANRIRIRIRIPTSWIRTGVGLEITWVRTHLKTELENISLPEMITIRFAGWIFGRIVSLQPDKDIQKLLSNGNRIRIRISETLLSIFRGFRLLEKVAHGTIIHLLSSEASFQPSAPWFRVCLWCKFWTVELCQVCQHEAVPGVAR